MVKERVTSKGSAGSGKSKGAKSKKPYPAITLEKAVQVAVKIKELNGGNPWTPEDIANAFQISKKTTAFFYLTAASRDFGLTTGTRDAAQIALSDFGRELVYASSADEERARKIEAFSKIELFDRVLKHYKGSNLPEMKYLGNTLEREFGLAPEYHEEFSKVFRDNCEYLGITKGEDVTGDDRAQLRPTVMVGELPKKNALRVFVIMPFTERHVERSKGFFDEVLRSLITPAALKAGFSVETANRQGSDVIQSTIINELLEADLVVADMTDHNPNVLFELGLRIYSEKPVALIKASGTGRVFDVDNMLRVFEYRSNLWQSTIETDLPELARHFAATWESRDKDQSYMKILRRAAQG